ncbi:MAG TPA: glycosyltransferase family 4 protein [Acidimicrobiia bacterium]|nr:glycosyltransferase family 4 protein [Acidimicrobiia bacterium]
MKIGLVCPYDLGVYGGVQQQVLELSRLLAATGDDPVLIGPGGGRHGGIDLGDSISIRGNRSTVPISIDPRVKVMMEHALAGVDVIHIHEPLMPVVSWAALTIDLPAVTTFHAAKPRWASLLYRLIPSRVFGNRILTAVSEVAGDLPARFGPIEIVPNGIDIARFRTGVQRHLQQIAFLGRPDPRKGFGVLTEAWRTVSERVPGAELVVIGIEGSERNRIRYLGRVDEDEKSQRLQASEIFVAPNLSGESFGVVVAEGMAAGCAVVASDIDAFRAVTGGTARLVPPGNAHHLAATLIELLRSPAATRDMGKRARQRVAEFDWTRVLDKYRDAYRRAIEIYKPAR